MSQTQHFAAPQRNAPKTAQETTSDQPQFCHILLGFPVPKQLCRKRISGVHATPLREVFTLPI
jgi:hypothetical protein